MPRSCEVMHVLAITFEVALQFRKCQVVSLQCEEAQVYPTASKEWDQPFFVILRSGRDRDSVQVYAVLSVQR